MSPVLRGTLTRFLPTVVAVMATIGGTAAVTTRIAPTLPGILMAAAEIGGLMLGYVGSLALLGRHLREDAGVDGRRGVVAGLASILVLVGASWLVQSVHPATAFGLSVLASAAVTGTLFAPWLTRGRRVRVVIEESAELPHE